MIEKKIYIKKHKNINNIIENFRAEIYSNLKKIKKTPIVSIMGHVDHGKTTLLDYLRSSYLQKFELGKITQKIGAYSVDTLKGSITFIDTPGHEIFNMMRFRGIQISDIIILIIAANDGIQPQTIEIIKNAVDKLPIIVAINKIELVDHTTQKKIINELMKYKIISTNLGGNNFIIPISAKTGKGVNKLLNTVLLQRDLLNLKTTEEGMVIATVIESSIDKNLGPLTTIIIESGILHKGNFVVCGNVFGKIKYIRDEYYKYIELAYPSMPIQILGLSEPPNVGDKLITVSTEKESKKIISYNKSNNIFLFNEPTLSDNNLEKDKKQYRMYLDNLENNKIINNIIIKADSYGTLEVIINYFNSLNKKTNNKNIFQIIHKGIGDITETDVLLSINTQSKILGFNIEKNTYVQNMIKQRNIYIKIYHIIYDLIKDINDNFQNCKNTENNEMILGLAKIQHIYKKDFSTILGCKVMQGLFKKNDFIKIYRKNKIIYNCYLNSLRIFKKDVNEVIAPIECGLSINKILKNIKIGDIVKAIKA